MGGSYKWVKINSNDVLVLNYSDSDVFSELTVLPNFGANILRFSYNGKTIIDYDIEKLENSDFTGMPILFPTPNRVRNCEIIFRDKCYTQVKNGNVRSCHGLVFDEPFTAEQINTDKNKAQVVFSLLIDENNDIFNSFPFECRLSLVYEIGGNGLIIKYFLENLSDTSIPYGFGIHPYFSVNGSERLIIPSKRLLQAIDCFPNGNIIDAKTVVPDLTSGGAIVGSLVLDTDFIRDCSKSISLFYTDINARLKINCSSNFKHIVVYKPENSGFICIEPQTCSVDAHYMHSNGFKHSDLLWVNKGEADCGTVEILIEREQKN